MTIVGWIIFVVLAMIFVCIGLCVSFYFEGLFGKMLGVGIAVILPIALLFGMLCGFNNTASGQRAFTDEKSEIANGLERTVTVYTADGKVLAQYTGKIDIEWNDGGYVLFDFEGKRYIYYNCFVESVAETGR